MKIMAILTFLVAAVSSKAECATFVISDPYPATATQPTEFRVKVDAGGEVVSPVFQDASGKSFRHEITALPNGPHSLVVRACNASQCSATSPPFAFVLGAPGVPAAVRILTAP